MAEPSDTRPTGGTGSGVPERTLREPVRNVTDRLVTGVLVKYGRAPLGFDPRNELSFYVTVDTERGPRTLWGRGLERALTESRTQPQPGQAIGIRENGMDPMTFVMRERDDRGNIKTERRTHTPRPRWIVERREFFNERATAAKTLRDLRASPIEAVRNHPELEDAYRALDSAKKLGSEQIFDRGSRDRFVALVREALARVVERGDRVPSPPKPRTTTIQTVTAAPTRSQDSNDRTR